MDNTVITNIKWNDCHLLPNGISISKKEQRRKLLRFKLVTTVVAANTLRWKLSERLFSPESLQFLLERILVPSETINIFQGFISDVYLTAFRGYFLMYTGSTERNDESLRKLLWGST